MSLLLPGHRANAQTKGWRDSRESGCGMGVLCLGRIGTGSCYEWGLRLDRVFPKLNGAPGWSFNGVPG